MNAYQARYPVTVMARVFKVSVSGFYAWKRRPASQRSCDDERLRVRIRTIHRRSRGGYGAPRIHAELVAAGVAVSRKRIARLMRLEGLQGVSRRKKIRTTVRNDRQAAPRDLVDRHFAVDKPDSLYVGDITYVPTAEGFLYLAIIVDAFSRRIIGWAMAGHMKTELVMSALDMAVEQRKPSRAIHHSDQGAQYTSLAFAKRCAAANIRPSTGSVGDCFDNALCESVFATLECELFDRQAFATHAEAESAIFGFIEGWYNPSRRHSALGFMSPAEFENKYWRAQQNKTAIAEAL